MTELLSRINLECREGTSDKVYQCGIEESGDGFVVNFVYGRRGATLNTGTKTSQPVPYAEAARICAKLVRSKTAKGYKPSGTCEAGAGGEMIVNDRDQCDTGLRPQLLNPIAEDETSVYLDDDGWCVQEKFNGKRMLIRKSGERLVAANRQGLCVGFPQAFATRLAITSDFVIDGESVGETFNAFDLLEDAAGDRRRMPYRARLAALRSQFGRLGGHIVVAETVYGPGKRKFMQDIRSARKEGVVLKNLDAAWSAGRPSSGGATLKCKFWATCSCIVAGVNTCRSVQLSLGGRSIGNVTIPPNYEIPKTGQVVEIRYLYVQAPGGSLYQPIYLGRRDDVGIEDCTEERQRIKYRPAA